MRLYTKRVDGEDEEELWIIYWEGQLARPIAVLSQIDMERLLRQVQDQKNERKQKDL